MAVLARAALMLLYWGGKPSEVFFLFCAGSRGGSFPVSQALLAATVFKPILLPRRGVLEPEGWGGFYSAPGPVSAELWREGDPMKTSFSREDWEIFAFFILAASSFSVNLLFWAAFLIVLNQSPPVRASPS